MQACSQRMQEGHLRAESKFAVPLEGNQAERCHNCQAY